MATKYWVGYSDTWSAGNSTPWSISSGGAGNYSTPTNADLAVFDKPGTYTVTILNSPSCNGIYIAPGANPQFVSGSGATAQILTNNSGFNNASTGATWNFGWPIRFFGTGVGHQIITNGMLIGSSITFSGSGTYTLLDNLSLSYDYGITHDNGNINLNNFNILCGTWTGSGSWTRTYAFGTGNIILANGINTPGTTVLDISIASGLTCTGTGGFTVVSGSSVTRTYSVGNAGAPVVAPNLTLSTGSSITNIQTITTGSYFDKLDFGTTIFTVPTTTVNVNSLTLSTGGTFTNLTTNIIGTGSINANTNTTLGNLAVNSISGTTTLISNITTTGSVSLTSGTLALNGYTLTTPLLSSTGTATRSITGSCAGLLNSNTTPNSTINLNGAGNTFTNASATGITISNCTMTMTSASAKTFNCATGFYAPTMTLNQGGAGTLSIPGSYTFANLTATTRPSTISISSTTTQTFNKFTLSGLSGSLVTLISASAGAKYNLVVPPGGPINVNYLSIQDCNASRYFGWTGTAEMLWYAGANSTNVSNNTGWIFTAGPTNNSSMLQMLL